MLFSRQLPLSDVIYFCHVLRLNLDAGVPMVKAFRSMSTGGPMRLRAVAGRILVKLEQGDGLRATLKEEQDYFPSLLVSIAGVGEKTGHLPEMLAEMENYFTLLLKSRRMIRQRSMLPAIQFVLGLGIIALLIFVLGAIAESRGTQPQPVLGFSGTSGAIKFVMLCACFFGGLFGLYLLIARVWRQQGLIDGVLLRLPGVGGCVEAFAVARFAMALQLTLDTSLPIAKALRLSMEAAGNAVFVGRTAPMVEAVGAGEALTAALGSAQVFPAEFLAMVAVGEEGGNVVEILRHQATHYQDLAGRRLQMLVRGITGLMWMAYVAYMVAVILSLAGMYLGPLSR